ncbi:MAG: DUF2892 domain-containing protein [Candidatus Thermoplasmatota archaeon]
MVKANMGRTDVIIRRFVALGTFLGALVAWFVYGHLVWTAVLGFFTLVLVVTTTLRFCPTYAPFGFRTNRGERNEGTPREPPSSRT